MTLKQRPETSNSLQASVRSESEEGLVHQWVHHNPAAAMDPDLATITHLSSVLSAVNDDVRRLAGRATESDSGGDLAGL